jgi:hypothetical protein
MSKTLVISIRADESVGVSTSEKAPTTEPYTPTIRRYLQNYPDQSNEVQKLLIQVAERAMVVGKSDRRLAEEYVYQILTGLGQYTKESRFAGELQRLVEIEAILQPFGGKKDGRISCLGPEYTGDAAQLGMILGKYEGYLARPLTSNELSAIAENVKTLALIACGDEYTSNVIGNCKSQWQYQSNEFARSSLTEGGKADCRVKSNLLVLELLIRRSQEEACVLAPEALISRLKLINNFLNLGEGEAIRSSPVLEATIYFITKQPRLVSEEELAVFIRRISEIPKTYFQDLQDRTAFPIIKRWSVLGEYLRYQERFGSPILLSRPVQSPKLLAEDEHILVKEIVAHSGKDINSLTAAFRDLTKIRETMGRELQEKEQAALIQFCRSFKNVSKVAEIMELAPELMRTHFEIAVQIGAESSERGERVADLISGFTAYLSALNDSNVPAAVVNQRLAMLSEFAVSWRTTDSQQSNARDLQKQPLFLKELIVYDRLGRFQDSVDLLRAFVQIVIKAQSVFREERFAVASSELCRMWSDRLIYYLNGSQHALTVTRLTMLLKLIELDITKKGSRTAAPGLLLPMILDWEKEIEGAISEDDLAGLEELLRTRKVGNEEQTLHPAAAAFIFKFAKKRGIKINAETVNELIQPLLKFSFFTHRTDSTSFIPTTHTFEGETAKFFHLAAVDLGQKGAQQLELTHYAHALYLLDAAPGLVHNQQAVSEIFNFARSVSMFFVDAVDKINVEYPSN